MLKFFTFVKSLSSTVLSFINNNRNNNKDKDNSFNDNNDNDDNSKDDNDKNKSIHPERPLITMLSRSLCVFSYNCIKVFIFILLSVLRCK